MGRDYTEAELETSGVVPIPTPAQLDQLAADIKQVGRDLGFAKLGIAATDLEADERRLERWLALGRHGTMSYMERHGRKRPRPAELVPGTIVEVIERCSGHNGTYAVKKEYRAASVKIGRPVVNRVEQAKADHYSSDCPMAGHQIESGLSDAGGGAPRQPEHPMTLVRKAYGI